MPGTISGLAVDHLDDELLFNVLRAGAIHDRIHGPGAEGKRFFDHGIESF
jgi:hypothetical protein